MEHQFRSIQPLRLAGLLTKAADQMLEEQCDLTYAQFKVLAILATQPETDQQNVAICLESTQAAISRLTETLESKGFITRVANPDNRRQNQLKLTTAGQHQLDRAFKLLRKMENELYQQLPEHLLNAFDQATHRLIEIIQTKAASTRA